jgi:flagellar hook-associated protein 2
MSINLSGLSGYDFSGIIEAMVESYKLPQNQMTDKVSKLTTQKSAWQEINTRLSALDTALAKLKSSSTWKATAATTPAANSYFTVTGSDSGIQGNYVVNVSQIAQSENSCE